MYLKINKIKSIAKEQLLPHMWTAVFFTLLYFCLSNLCSFCIMFFPGSRNIWELFLYEFTTLLINLFHGLLQVGVASFYLKIATNQSRCSFLDMFVAFAKGPDRAIKVTFVLSLLRITCTLPYVIYSLYVVPADSMIQLFEGNFDGLRYLGMAYLLLGAGELIYFLIGLFFEPIYFMLADMPELNAGKALKMSIWLMKGSKIRLLGLILSFLPLQFVSLFTFGIGNLWLKPYMNTAMACFYTDLAAKRLNQ